MYLIGIDISKYKHDCFIATEAGEIIKESFSFDNSLKGFNLLLKVFESLDLSQTKRIGLEATGHYGYNLKVFLDQNGFDYMEFNPYRVKKLATGLSLRKTKTDKADAKLLSLILLSVDYKVYPVKSYHIHELKSLTRYYRILVKKRSKEIVILTNILDLVFPEFKKFFDNRFPKIAFYILTHYQTPARIARLNSKTHSKLNSLSKGHFSYARFTKLKLLARHTIGNSSDTLIKQLLSCIRLIKAIQYEIDSVSSDLLNYSLTLDSPVLTIPGVGYISALSIISEYGNFYSFSTPAKLLSFAGLEPSVNQSGQTNKKGHMVKRGSTYLRNTIMNVSIPFMMHNPVIYDYYLKKRNEGKCHRVALSHVAKKLIRIIFYLVKNNLSFDSSKLQ